MCASMVDIQSATAETIKKKKNKGQDENIYGVRYKNPEEITTRIYNKPRLTEHK